MAFLICFFLALGGGALVSWMAGENPIQVYLILLNGAFGSLDALGYTLFYATPFLFTGLAVSVPYRVGLFNIGAEGQLYMGAFFLWAAYSNFGVSSLFGLMGAAFLGGAFWSSLAGVLKAWRGCHEVITTILMNFLSLGLCSYGVLYLWKDPSSQRVETSLLAESLRLPRLQLGDSPLNLTFLLGIFMTLLVWIFLSRTKWGFRMAVVGKNSAAAQASGYSASWAIFGSMALGGALAAGAAINEILGHSYRFIDGFSPGYGFVGIAVAFLGKNHPLGILLSATFLGALYKGSGELDIETQAMTRDFSVVMQALFIAAVSCEQGVQKLLHFGRRVTSRGR